MSSVKPNHRKWVIVATMLAAIICNYIDRQLLSILKPEILHHFGIGNFEYALIVNVFLVCYAVMYPISGILVDKFGPKKVMLGGIAVWSLACIGGGFCGPNQVVLFTVFRGFLGLSEPTIFAGQIVAVTLWFEKEHRALATSICNIGGSIGAIVAPILIGTLMHVLSVWQNVFFVAGISGLVIAVIWFFVYKTPPKEVLQKTVQEDDTDDASKLEGFSLGGLFKTKTLWGGILVRLLSDPVWYFCCFWLPGFLRSMGENAHLTEQQTLDMITWVGGIPFLFAAAGGLLFCALSDKLIRKGMDGLKARKRVLIGVSIAGPLCCIVPFIAGSGLALGLKIGLVVAIFCVIAALCNTWLYMFPVTLVEQFPIKNAASVMGIAAGAGALGSVVFNQFTGSIPESGWLIVFCILGFLHLISSIVVWKMIEPQRKGK